MKVGFSWINNEKIHNGFCVLCSFQEQFSFIIQIILNNNLSLKQIVMKWSPHNFTYTTAYCRGILTGIARYQRSNLEEDG